MIAPDVPRYGSGSLSDILPSIAARWGIGAGPCPLEAIPAAETYVVWLVDGLGWEQLGDFGHLAPYLVGLANAQQSWLHAGVPSTTCTSLTSFGTGLPPGRHGVAGYRFYLPEIDSVFGPLQWDCFIPPEAVQPEPTYFERLAAMGPEVTTVAPVRFAGSGLTELALRGGRFVGLDDEGDDEARLAAIEDAVAAGPGVVYVYLRDLDHQGHKNGVSSQEWRDELSRADRLCRQTRERLPNSVRIIVTGDHGMIDIPQDRRLSLEELPGVRPLLTHVAGEGRFRHLYAKDARGVKNLTAELLGDRAWVYTREEAVSAGWFGEIEPSHLSRFGDVMVAMRGNWALMSRTLPGEWNLVGMHGSLTSAEQRVPLLVD